MKRIDRIKTFETILGLLLARGRDGAYATFSVQGNDDEYVQFQLHDGTVYGEVGSRQWTEPERPLPKASITALAKLGFTGGGPERNFAKDELPASPAKLAQLTESLFIAAYAPDDEFSPLVKVLDLHDVTFPRPEAFTRELLGQVVHEQGLHFMTDEDGDIRFELHGDEPDDRLVIWACVQGDDGTICHICSSAPEPPRALTREQYLERCNEWNRDHRWPKATLVDADDGTFRVLTSVDVALEHGVTRPQLTDVVRRSIGTSVDFWLWLAAAEQPSGAGDPRDARGGGS